MILPKICVPIGAGFLYQSAKSLQAMIDLKVPFHILGTREDFQGNLQFCCDHYRSISEVCRRLKINRQQFNRYLTGAASPSRYNYKRISNFFGLEEDELYRPHSSFIASFTRRAAMETSPALNGPYDRLFQSMSGPNAEALAGYQGYYFKYFYTYLGGQRIKRELVHWHFDQEMLLSSTKQRYLGDEEEIEKAMRFVSYRGIVGNLGDRVFTIDSDRGSGREVSMTMLYQKGRVLKKLHGMMIAIGHGSGRLIGAARVTMDFLGTDADIRAALAKLGTFEMDDPSVPAAIKRAISNDIRHDETLFLVRT